MGGGLDRRAEQPKTVEEALSINAACSSAETLTLRGVSKKPRRRPAGSPPSSEEVEPGGEAIRRLDSSASSLEVDDHRDRSPQLVGDVLGVVEGLRDDETHADLPPAVGGERRSRWPQPRRRALRRPRRRRRCSSICRGGERDWRRRTSGRSWSGSRAHARSRRRARRPRSGRGPRRGRSRRNSAAGALRAMIRMSVRGGAGSLPILRESVACRPPSSHPRRRRRRNLDVAHRELAQPVPGARPEPAKNAGCVRNHPRRRHRHEAGRRRTGASSRYRELVHRDPGLALLRPRRRPRAGLGVRDPWTSPSCRQRRLRRRPSGSAPAYGTICSTLRDWERPMKSQREPGCARRLRLELLSAVPPTSVDARLAQHVEILERDELGGGEHVHSAGSRRRRSPRGRARGGGDPRRVDPVDRPGTHPRLAGGDVTVAAVENSSRAASRSCRRPWRAPRRRGPRAACVQPRRRRDCPPWRAS